MVPEEECVIIPLQRPRTLAVRYAVAEASLLSEYTEWKNAIAGFTGVVMLNVRNVNMMNG